MSLLFVGYTKAIDPDQNLYVELNELGELAAYYGSSQEYQDYECPNLAELFITNVFMSPVIVEQACGNPLNKQLGYILQESLEEKDYSLINPTTLKRHDPSPLNDDIDIIPALQCIGTHFLTQNLFNVDIFPVLQQIQQGMIRFAQVAFQGQGLSDDFPNHSHYMLRTHSVFGLLQNNKRIDPLFCQVAEVYERYSDRKFMTEL